jgi:hypothetical protein
VPRRRRPEDDIPLPVGDAPRLPLRRRVLIALLAVAVACVVAWLLLYRPGDPKRGLPFATQAQCPDGKGSGCVGGKAEVRVIAPPASR